MVLYLLLASTGAPLPADAAAAAAASNFIAPPGPAASPLHVPPAGLDTTFAGWCDAVKEAQGRQLTVGDLDSSLSTSSDPVFVVTPASAYKWWEYAAFASGLPVSHVLNTGASVGQTRVGLHEAARCLFAALQTVKKEGGDESKAPPVVVLARLDGVAPPAAALQAGAAAAAAASGDIAGVPIYAGGEGASALAGVALPPAAVAALAAWATGSGSSSNEDSATPVLGRLLSRSGYVPVSALCGSGATCEADDTTVSFPSSPHEAAPAVVTGRACARVGLLGNPSDGYGGATLSACIANFGVEVRLTPNADPRDARVSVLPHPLSDPTCWGGGLGHLSTVAAREGYSGGLRLLLATLHRYRRYLGALSPPLPAHRRPPTRGFAVTYHTTVPRQVGLAGSSAIITAFLRAVRAYYGYDVDAADGLSPALFASFVLSIEVEELGIAAGLQDRVVQAYGGAVHMDFAPERALVSPAPASLRYGVYTPCPVTALPPLFLAWAADPSDSGRIHAPVKARWLAGEPEVVSGLAAIGALAHRGKALLDAAAEDDAGAAPPSPAALGAYASAWAGLFAANFSGRRALWGDAALGADNLAMIGIAKASGAAAKFPGSGGAVVGVVDVEGMGVSGSEGKSLPPGYVFRGCDCPAFASSVAAGLARLQAAYTAAGYVFAPLYLAAP